MHAKELLQKGMMKLLTKMQNIRRIIAQLRGLEIAQNSILIDFDECICQQHASRMNTLALCDLKNIKLDYTYLSEIGECSFEGISYFNTLSYGLSLDQYHTLLKVLDSCNIRVGFKEFLREFVSRKDFSVFIVSSGNVDVVYEVVKKIDFPRSNIIGTVLTKNLNQITDQQINLFDQMKGLVTKFILRRSKYCFAIGHSNGDLAMLQKITPNHFSISISPTISNQCDYYTNTALGIESIIEYVLNKKL